MPEIVATAKKGVGFITVLKHDDRKWVPSNGLCYAMKCCFSTEMRGIGVSIPASLRKGDYYWITLTWGGWRRTVIVACGRALSRAMLFVFGFYWIPDISTSTTQENKHQPEDMGRPGVIISNHVSYLDILYHMSNSFPSFVAKMICTPHGEHYAHHTTMVILEQLKAYSWDAKH